MLTRLRRSEVGGGPGRASVSRASLLRFGIRKAAKAEWTRKSRLTGSESSWRRDLPAQPRSPTMRVEVVR